MTLDIATAAFGCVALGFSAGYVAGAVQTSRAWKAGAARMCGEWEKVARDAIGDAMHRAEQARTLGQMMRGDRW